MGKRNLYLNNTPVEEALAVYQRALDGILTPKTERIPVTESLNPVSYTHLDVYKRQVGPFVSAPFSGEIPSDTGL